MSEAHPGRAETPAWWPTWCRRVVLVAPRYPEVSGGSRYIDNLAVALAEIDVSTEVFSIYPGTSTALQPVTTVIAREPLHRNPVLRTSEPLWRRVAKLPLLGFKYIDRLHFRSAIRRRMHRYGEDAAIIFTHVLAKEALDRAGVDSTSLRASLVGQHHSSFQSLEFEPGLESALRESFADVDAFTALSKADAEEFATMLAVPCFSVANMLSPSFEPAERPSEPLPAVAVALARLTEEKQLDLMIRSFVRATASDELRHWRLEIYGEGYQRAMLASTISSLGVEDRVQLRGTTSDVVGVLSRASVHLVTSRYEGFGLSVLEAAQSGVMTIAFDCSPGLHQLMVDVDGVLVPPVGGEDAMVRSVRLVLSDPVGIRARGDRARAGAQAYAPNVILRDWATMLDSAHRGALTRLGADRIVSST